MIYNLYATWDSSEEIRIGRKGTAYAERYVNVDHMLLSFDIEKYTVEKVDGKDLFYVQKKKCRI